MPAKKKPEKKLFSELVSERGEPHDIAVERVVLGAIMLEEDCIEKVVRVITNPEVFYNENHRIIYSAILKLRENKTPIDILTVTDQLRKENKLADVGGAYVVTEITSEISSTAHTEYHAFILFQFFLRRNLTKYAMALYEQATDLTSDELATFDDAILKLENLKREISLLKEVDFTKQVDDTIQEIIDEMNGKRSSIQTGFTHNDSITGGRVNGELTILAARPGMGKTSRAIKEMLNISLGDKRTVGLISLETKYRQLIKKVLSNMTRIDSNLIRLSKLNLFQMDELHEAARILKDHQILIHDVSAMKLTDIGTIAAKWKALFGLEILYVDYLTLIKQQNDYKSTNDEVGKIANGLKNIAMDLNIPVIALAQLNRESERRNDKRPMLSDLRDSGDIEQAADVVSFLFRPEYYGQLFDEDGNSLVGVTEEITRKNRNGTIGTAYHRFHPAICDFEPLGFIPVYGKTSNSYSPNGENKSAKDEVPNW